MTAELIVAAALWLLAIGVTALSRRVERAGLRALAAGVALMAAADTIAPFSGHPARSLTLVLSTSAAALIAYAAYRCASDDAPPPAIAVRAARALVALAVAGGVAMALGSEEDAAARLLLLVLSLFTAAALAVSAIAVVRTPRRSGFAGRAALVLPLFALAAEFGARRQPGSPQRVSGAVSFAVLDAMLLTTLTAGVIILVFDALAASTEVGPVFDTLTGLPRRRHFRGRLGAALATAADAGHRAAVMFLDLDRFKQINDTLGHAAGDAVLRAVSSRIRSVLGSQGEICRLGGDEFSIVVPRVASAEDACALAARIRDAVVQPVVHVDRTIPISTSIGIAIFPDDATDDDALLHCADQALYGAKRRGRDAFLLYASLTQDASPTP